MNSLMSDGNWLATLGHWLVVPVKALFRPWWEQLVEKKAELKSVRLKLLEAIVRFRLHDCKQMHNLDTDRAGGIAIKVIDRLKPALDDPSIDVTGEGFLKLVENEIELHSIKSSAWVQLACLAYLQEFNPNQSLVVEFTDDNGSQSHASSVIVSLQSGFPFTKIMTFTNDPNVLSSAVGMSMIGRISADATTILKEHCSRTNLPEAKFELSDFVAMMNWPHQFAGPKVLPRNWKPD
jgi:hypothetical protein